jgi:hypothetical protein
MTDKTVGQIAYEAYCKASNHPYHLTADEWKDLLPDHKHAWEAAAQAVIYLERKREDIIFAKGYRVGREEAEQTKDQ